MSAAAGHELDTQVVIAGAGPVGLLLAIELGRRGVDCVLLEREPTTLPWPKADRSNARTMEFFRRMGIADRVRALGFPPEVPMDVLICDRLADPPVAVLRHPSVAEARAAIAACTDGSLPLEPYQLVAQNALEPLFKELADATPHVSVRYGHELREFRQDAYGVTVTVAPTGGPVQSLRAAYLVGADGGRSTVRKALGIRLEGEGGLADVVQVIFRSPDLFDRIAAGPGRHYNFTDAQSATLVAQGSRTEFTFHSSLPPDTDFEPVIRELVGFDFTMEIQHVVPWRYQLLMAPRYRDHRVFLAGDAAHLVIPTGGLGMNTGVGDAMDLAWKLAATLAGWGGPILLDSYEVERRPVGLRNLEATGRAAAAAQAGRALLRSATPPGPDDIAASAEGQNQMHIMRGVELGYVYEESPVIAVESGPTGWDVVTYSPTARPGARIPHMWLSDGRALQDVLGTGWTLLDLGSHEKVAVVALADALRSTGAPVEVLALPDEEPLRKVYEASLLLLRPDLHVAWRGEAPPADVAGLALLVTGHPTTTSAGGPTT